MPVMDYSEDYDSRKDISILQATIPPHQAGLRIRQRHENAQAKIRKIAEKLLLNHGGELVMGVMRAEEALKNDWE
ncbi:hypothetical protein Acr_00g0100430 [Actinidia rufa]|uniref:Uncharacterized protein n=1 Tax=Actinidia rufa TaxID=165716 RepID=A0A7J0E017_9ERIC|nr:hypothetical protein Acr_00g0100430 [Actinidia rufa]